MLTIHNFPGGGRGLRVFWLCEEMGLTYRTEAVGFPVSDAYRALNPIGSVPFLQDEGGVAINESTAMLLYLARKYGPTPLLPDERDPAFARVLQMTVFGETAIGMNMNPLMDAHFGAPEADQRNWSVRMQEARMEKALSYVIDMLGDQPYLAGGNFSLADISVCCALGIWRGALGKTIPEKLAAYRAGLTERPAYQRALKAR